jgi:NADH-quinone oxidoreductase subunit M
VVSPVQIPFGEQVGWPVLSALIVFPLLLAPVLARLRDDRWAARVGEGGALVWVLLHFYVLWSFRSQESAFQLVEEWVSPLGLSWHAGVDGISVLLLVMVGVLNLLVAIYAGHVGKERIGGYLATTSAVAGFSAGALCSLDVLQFWGFLVLGLGPSAWMIDRWGVGEGRREAALRYAAHFGVSAVLILAGILLNGWFLHPIDHGRFDLLTWLEMTAPPEVQAMGFLLLALGFAMRVPLFPFHTWLPWVVEHGPLAGTGAFVVGLKLGAFGLLRFAIPAFPDAANRFGMALAVLAVITTFYGGLLALSQTSMRRMLAFACVSQVGPMVLGLATLNEHGLEGALLQMINLGLASAGLYFLAGFLMIRLGKPDLSNMGGLAHKAPLLGLSFLLLALANIGMPGPSGSTASTSCSRGPSRRPSGAGPSRWSRRRC